MKIDAISSFNIPDLNKTNTSNNNQNNINFGDILKNQLDKLNDTQLNADQASQDLITGKATDISQVLIATQEAQISLDLATQIRNKLVDAYQEINRMQI